MYTIDLEPIPEKTTKTTINGSETTQKKIRPMQFEDALQLTSNIQIKNLSFSL